MGTVLCSGLSFKQLVLLVSLCGSLDFQAASASNCPTKWFDCGNGKCISMLWHCDGEDDCGNGHDELDSNCKDPPNMVASNVIRCPVNHFPCNQTDICLPDRWKCDGHPDCPDGGDELACAKVKCLGFQCLNHECIPHKWHCDDVIDCEDSSDELNCPRNSTHHSCTISGVLFECTTGECVPRSKVCDGHPNCPHGEDEGDHCSEVQDCTAHNCSHGCFVTPTGQQCYCHNGYELETDHTTCVDINECQIPGFCSQSCINTAGSFRCSCLDGYKQVNATHCEVEGPEPLLLFSDSIRIRALNLRSGKYFPVHDAIKQVIGLDMYSVDKRVFWADHGEVHSGIYSCNLDGSNLQPVVSAGLKEPEDVAVDWVGQNIYITDALLDKIVVCKLDGSICSALFNDIHFPRSIALDPSRGTMYWTEWGQQVGIYQAGMDGSERLAIARVNLRWPNGLTFDITTQRLYWCDAQYNKIEYFDINTKQRHSVLEDTVFHPFSMAVFEDNLYWSDWITYSLDTCNKFTGRNQTILLRESNQLMGVHVYHPVLHSNGHSPCWSDQCSHLCLLGPRKTFTCACPGHMILGGDGRTCVSNSTNYLLVGVEKSVKKIHPESIGRDVVYDVVMPHHMMVGDYTFDEEHNVIYVFDVNKYVIAAVNATSGTSRVIISSHIDTAAGLTYCPMTHNLYWLEVNKGHLEAASVATAQRVSLVTDLERPIDLVIHPSKRYFFIANLGSNPYILRSDMDGHNRIKIVASQIGLPVALHICPMTNVLYWADAKRGTIDSMQLTEDNVMNNRRREVRKGLGHVMSIAVENNTVYWTDMDHGYLYHASLNDKNEKAALVPLPGNHNGSHVKKIKVVTGSTEDNLGNLTTRCAHMNGGCAHVCLVGASGEYCVCSNGYNLDKDDKSCVEEVQECREGEWRCADGTECLLDAWHCDGNIDCADSSDEKNCSHCDSETFTCTDGKCINSIWRCDQMDDCGDGSDEMNCTEHKLCAEGLFNCGQGQCLPFLWRCDGKTDCSNSKDEQSCENSTTCQGDKTQLQCHNGQCIPLQWQCDGEDDCGDNTDELKCHLKACEEEQFRCKNNVCIDVALVCDKEQDCTDGSDEEACKYAPVTCLPEQFTCAADGHCIYPADVCDGHEDCANGEDEANCTAPHICSKHESYCNPGTKRECVPLVWLCDGENDCGDWSDETRPQCQLRKEALPTTTGRPCWDGSFPCKSGDCIPYELVCDKNHDCLDSSDEGSHCSAACDNHNGGCSQLCRSTPLGASCACKEGYVLGSDGKTCSDIDECQEDGLCSHFCENSLGSYRCTCAHGWMLTGDRKRCKPDPKTSGGSEAFLLYMLPNKIRSIGLESHAEYLISEIDSLDMKGMDYDMRTGNVFWIEGNHGAIMAHSFAAHQHGSNSTRTRTIRNNLVRPSHLAWDWLGRNFYFFSEGFIHACNHNGSYCFQVVPTGHSHINSLLVVPEKGFLFFTVWTETTSANAFGLIERADMDGLKRRRVVTSDNRVLWPSCLTADSVHERIYWTDTFKGTIGVSDYNGRQRKTLLAYSLSHPFGLGLFEDNLFIANLGTDTMTKVSKFDGRSRTIFHRGDVKSEMIKIVHKVLQLSSDYNPCANATCHHLCLLKPNGHVCSCDRGFTLALDGSCLPDEDGGEDKKELDRNEATTLYCDDSLCDHHGTCTIFNEQWTCHCDFGYDGPACQEASMSSLESGDVNIFGWVLLSVVFCMLFVGIAIAMSFIYKGPYEIRSRINKQSFSKPPNPFKNFSIHFKRPFEGIMKKDSSLLEDTDHDHQDYESETYRREPEITIGSERCPRPNYFQNPAFGTDLVHSESSAHLMPRVDTGATDLGDYNDTDGTSEEDMDTAALVGAGQKGSTMFY